MSQADILAKYGIQNAQAVVSAAAKVGVPLYIAVAFVQHESGGANVFGHDAGGAYSGGGTVTKAKYQDFLRMVRSGHTSNGVGPLQVTYYKYFLPNTAEVANLWQPEANIVFGLKIIKGYLAGNYSDTNLNRAGQIYNSGRANGAPQYGAITVNNCHIWAQRLGTSIPPAANIPTSNAHADTGQDLNAASSPADIKGLQHIVGVKADGVAGPLTVNALEKLAGYKPDGRLDPAGSNTLRKVQARINQQIDAGKMGNTKKLATDGLWGPKSAAAFHTYLAKGGRLTGLASQSLTPKAPAKKPAAPKTTAFPLPAGHAYAVNDGTAYTHSGVNAKDQPAIERIQKKIGVNPDGIYGPKTKAAVAKAQKSHKITADGEVGPTTWKALAL